MQKIIVNEKLKVNLTINSITVVKMTEISKILLN